MKWLNQSVPTQSWRGRQGPQAIIFTNSWGVVMVVGDEFQSQLCLTIQYTNGERLEGLRLRCCELPESVSTHSIWVRKVGLGQAKFVPTHDQKTGCGGHFRAHTPI